MCFAAPVVRALWAPLRVSAIRSVLWGCLSRIPSTWRGQAVVASRGSMAQCTVMASPAALPVLCILVQLPPMAGGVAVGPKKGGGKSDQSLGKGKGVGSLGGKGPNPPKDPSLEFKEGTLLPVGQDGFHHRSRFCSLLSAQAHSQTSTILPFYALKVLCAPVRLKSQPASVRTQRPQLRRQ